MLRQVPGIAASFLLIGLACAAAPNPSLDWLAGHWCADLGEESVEEFWLPSHGGVAVGLGRTTTKDHTTAFEYFRIVDLDGVPSYIAQPGGRPPTTFTRTAGGERWIRFENPDHDFPRRVEYRRQGDALHAEIAGPGENGTEVVIPFDYLRCGLVDGVPGLTWAPAGKPKVVFGFRFSGRTSQTVRMHGLLRSGVGKWQSSVYFVPNSKVTSRTGGSEICRVRSTVVPKRTLGRRRRGRRVCSRYARSPRTSSTSSIDVISARSCERPSTTGKTGERKAPMKSGAT